MSLINPSNIPVLKTVRAFWLVISLLVHFLVFDLFRFYFPTQPQPITPQLFFLGSVLKFKDLDRGIYHASTESMSSHKKYQPKIPSQKLASQTVFKKPETTNNHKKITPKSLFSSEPRKNKTLSGSDQNMSAEQTEIFYKPLSIDPNDSN